MGIVFGIGGAIEFYGVGVGERVDWAVGFGFAQPTIC
jgi:hypothetical protein